jgi:microcystin-dependent protein
MSDQFLGEVRIVPFSFAPSGWAMCNGQILPIAQYSALFDLLRTHYGGNGTTTFALPDFRGRVPLAPGQGTGLSDYSLGESDGEEKHTLLAAEMPAHTHAWEASTGGAGLKNQPVGALTAHPTTTRLYHASGANNANMAPMTTAGGGQGHNNLQPYLTLNFIIALTGVFPARN